MNNLLGCPECGLVMKDSASLWLTCPRCDSVVKKRAVSLEFLLGLAIASALLFFPAMLLPLLTFKLGNSDQVNTMFDTVYYFYVDGHIELAMVVLFTAILAPLIQIVLSLCMLYPLSRGIKPRYMRTFYKILFELREWIMLDVYVIGILVAIVKLSADYELVYGRGLIVFVSLMISNVLLTNLFCPKTIWKAYHYAK